MDSSKRGFLATLKSDAGECMSDRDPARGSLVEYRGHSWVGTG